MRFLERCVLPLEHSSWTYTRAFARNETAVSTLIRMSSVSSLLQSQFDAPIQYPTLNLIIRSRTPDVLLFKQLEALTIQILEVKKYDVEKR